MAAAFRDSPETARRLAVVARHEPQARHPARPQPRPDRDGRRRRHVRAARAATSWSTRPGPRSTCATERRRPPRARCAASPIAKACASAPTTCSAWSRTSTVRRWSGPALSDLATAALVVAVEHAEPAVPFAVLALGRLGGAELAYSSDLDLLLVHGGRGPGGPGRGRAGAAEVHRFLVGDTPADARVRGRPRPAARGPQRPGRPLVRRLPRLLRALGPDLGAPGDGAGPAGRRRPRRSAGGCSTTSSPSCGRRSPTTTGGRSAA